MKKILLFVVVISVIVFSGSLLAIWVYRNSCQEMKNCPYVEIKTAHVDWRG